MPYTPIFTPETLTREAVSATAGPLVLEFGTNWCHHCAAAQPGVAAAFAEHGAAVPHVKVEDGRGRPLGRSFDVKLWPTLIFLRDGHEVARVVRPTETQPVADALAALAQGG